MRYRIFNRFSNVFNYRYVFTSATCCAGLAFYQLYINPSASCFQQEQFQDFSDFPFRLISLQGNPALATEISEISGVPITPVKCTTFADGECQFQVGESVRGQDIYLIQSFSDPVHDTFVEALIAISCLRRASAKTITLVAPYLCYSRVDRAIQGKTIAAADCIRLLQTAGCDAIITVDIHRRQTEGFATNNKNGKKVQLRPLEFDSLESLRLTIPLVLELDLYNLVIVCPSSTGVTRAKKFMELLKGEGVHGDLAFVASTDKSGSIQAEEILCHHKVPTENMIIGDVSNSDVLIIDDMIDTGSRVATAADLCKKAGAKRIYAYATHGIFSGGCLEVLEDSAIDEVFVTNTVPYRDDKFSRKISYTSVAPLIAEAIRRKTVGHSLQTLTHL